MASIPHPGRPTAPTLPRGTGASAQPSVVRRMPEGLGVVRRRFSRLTIASFALLAAGVVGLVQVLQTTQVAATGYEVRALEREAQDLDADIRLLEAQIAASSNLDQIQKEATGRLAMVRPQQKVRVAADVPAPAIVPLPRRYVPTFERQEPPAVTWWERLLGNLPGLN